MSSGKEATASREAGALVKIVENPSFDHQNAGASISIYPNPRGITAAFMHIRILRLVFIPETSDCHFDPFHSIMWTRISANNLWGDHNLEAHISIKVLLAILFTNMTVQGSRE